MHVFFHTENLDLMIHAYLYIYHALRYGEDPQKEVGMGKGSGEEISQVHWKKKSSNPLSCMQA